MPAAVSSRRAVHRSHRRSSSRPGVSRRRLVSVLAGELATLAVSRVLHLGTVAIKAGTGIPFLVQSVGLVYLVAGWRIDGRPGHTVLRSLLAMWLRPARLIGWRAAPARSGAVAFGAVTVAPDERGSRLRPGIISGPAHLLVRYPCTLRRRWRSVCLEPLPGPSRWRGTEIVIASGQRVVIR